MHGPYAIAGSIIVLAAAINNNDNTIVAYMGFAIMIGSVFVA